MYPDLLVSNCWLATWENKCTPLSKDPGQLQMTNAVGINGHASTGNAMNNLAIIFLNSQPSSDKT